MEPSLTTPPQGDMVCRALTHQFGVVRSHGIFLNYTFTGGINTMYRALTHQFGVVRSLGTLPSQREHGGYALTQQFGVAR